MKKNLSILLAALMLLATLAGAVACAEKPANTDSTTANAGTQATPDETTNGETTPQFVFKNYGDTNFVVYMRNESAGSYPGRYIDTEDVSETISAAVYQRNSIVESQFGIKIETIQTADPYKTVENDVKGDSVEYDVILDRRSYLSSLAKKGLLHNFNDMEIDFSRPWWDKNTVEQYAIGDKLYFVGNDISVANLSGARFFYFNKKMVEDYHLTDPYSFVEKNEWILDNFLTMVKSVVNGEAEGTLGTYGILLETGDANGNYMHLLTGCGVRQTYWEDGNLISAFDNQSEKIQTIFDKINVVFKDPTIACDYTTAEKLDTSGGTFANKYDRGRNNFAMGHFLFVQNGMGIAAQFSEMEGEGYGIVPNPKYDSDQENYAHKIDKYSLIFCIPESASHVDFEKDALVLDYWAHQWSLTVVPA
ncbi:MAG: hypothetical protein MJ137_03845 [Clostridia bacterium]|nr:hypothetical protein [Clostridia bacterium]